MDIRRVILYAALALVGYSLWLNWQKDYPPAVPVQTHSMTEEKNALLVPHDNEPASTSYQAVQENVKPNSQKIHVRTDVLQLTIDLQQGDIVNANLLDYPVSVDEKDKPFQLLQANDSQRYVAESSLFQLKDGKTKSLGVVYHTVQDNYQLNDGQQELVVRLTTTTAEGLVVQKEFIFKRGSYLINVRYALKNEGKEFLNAYMNTTLLRTSPKEDKSSMMHVGSYTGASYSSAEHRYKKIPFAQMIKSPLDMDTAGGWIAMQQHYFLSAWIPNAKKEHHFYTRVADNDFSIGSVSQAVHLAPQGEGEVSSQLYLGPEITSDLKAIAPGLDLTVDYGWLWFLSSILFSLMKSIYTVVGNWGWSIVLVTVLIKLAFYRLSATSYKSMAAMRKLQPKLQSLRDRYGDDKAKISQATMELYRQEKVNPLGGCLPIVIQIPVFIALYWVLLESVQLRQAPFIFWIKDLATADPYHILPVIMGATMLIQQKLNPAPPDPMQAKVMMFLPVLFTGLFWSFPAGLVLYWIVNNSLSILQQWYITRKYSETSSTSKWATAK
jgi:YidC/Oxa1 family membrane protein insertase